MAGGQEPIDVRGWLTKKDGKVNILVLAPHPFYQDRGSPIRLSQVLRVLSERGGLIDVLAYHEGELINEDKLTIYRSFNVPFMNHIQPGFSWKKVICDIFMFSKATRLAFSKRYHMLYALEESVFMALVLKWLFKIPYIYAMDSSLAQQMVERYPFLRPLLPCFNCFEKLAVRNALAVIPVCNALADAIVRYHPTKVVILQDVTLLKGLDRVEHETTDLPLVDGLMLMYVGNLAPYQGIDLLLESFAWLLERTKQADLVIIGGHPSDIHKYQKKSHDLGIQGKVHFCGPRPPERLGEYLAEADILVSPRISGENTPMKLYSYLDSGVAILATDIPTHTQVLDARVAMLAEPSPKAFSEAMLRLINDEKLRRTLGQAGKRLVEEQYSYHVFREKLKALFDWLEVQVGREAAIEATNPKRFPKMPHR
jgi:glycosyltransferase involved in cell wall biosynthesis